MEPLKKEEPVDLKKKYQRVDCENLLKRQFFYAPSFDIYGGCAGLFDYGPLGSALKSNIESIWRQHFILEEDILELTCTCVTMEEVLKVSGHVAKFADFMVKDLKNGNPHRADKLIEDAMEKVIMKKAKKMTPEERARVERIMNDCENYNAEQLDECIKNEKIKSPDGNELSEAVPFNLMFATEIGPTGGYKGFLRPETAQGIFVNFRKLIEFNNGRMPMAGAQIGLGFRNEISPKQGLLRVREFQMAEIEHFVDPLDKSHKRFKYIADEKLPLLTADAQESGEMTVRTDLTVGEAVATKLIDNETLAYFVTRTYLFLQKVGINPAAIRFRQHRSNEMAHYATDCWDAEVQTSYGWIEVAGHADRSCYDVERHMQKTKVDLVASRRLKEEKTIQLIKTDIDKKVIAKAFKKETKSVMEYVENMTDEQKEQHIKQLEGGEMSFTVGEADEAKEFKLNADMIKFERIEKVVSEEKFIPHVIEPSFGLGRIMYCVFEHCFKIREEAEQDAKKPKRSYFDFPCMVAPIKCSILPLLDKPELNDLTYEMKRLLVTHGLSSKIDDTGISVGKKYARTDECGIPYAFTVDTQTPEDKTVTMRELDTMKQIRIPIAEVPAVLKDLVAGSITWASVLEKYPLFQAVADEK